MRVLLAARHPHRRRLAQRLDGDVVHPVVLALEADMGAAQELHRGLEDLIGAGAALLAGAAGGLELGPVPAGADPIDKSAAAEVLEGRDLLGEQDRLPRRQDEDRRAELDAARHRGHVRQGHHRLGPADAVEPRRGQQVIGDEERVEAELLRFDRKTADLVAVPGVLAGQEIRGNENANLHAGTSANCDLSLAGLPSNRSRPATSA